VTARTELLMKVADLHPDRESRLAVALSLFSSLGQSADVLSQVKKIPNEVDRLRLLIEVEKVSLLSEIAQGIAFYHDCQ
jgi:hypothetical protein